MEEKSCFESELLWMVHFACCLVLVYLRTMSFLKYINEIFNNSNTWCICETEQWSRVYATLHALFSVYAPFMLVLVCPNFFLLLSRSHPLVPFDTSLVLCQLKIKQILREVFSSSGSSQVAKLHFKTVLFGLVWFACKQISSLYMERGMVANNYAYKFLFIENETIIAT